MMRNLRDLDKYRKDYSNIYGSVGDASNGVFAFESPIDSRALLLVIAACDAGWDHVSVSVATRCPIWQEMEFIKRKFFKDSECAMQLHVPVEDHINAHPNCLHLWRPTSAEIPRPPGWMVAPKVGEQF